jgi:tetratricopeptide (TPR) repeat protein
MANEQDTAAHVSTSPAEVALPAPAGARPAWLNQADLLLLVFLLALSFLLGSFAASNSDVWMQLATGRRLAEGQYEFAVDPYSVATQATAHHAAVPWIDHSWLFSLLLYALYSALGGAGVIVLKALLFVATMALLFQVRQRQTSLWLLVICLTLAALAISTRFFLQPLVISVLFLALTVYLLHRAGVFRRSESEGGLPRPGVLWFLPPLFALWANLDEWFILGPLAVILCAGAAGLLRVLRLPRPVSGRTLALVSLVGLAACLLNPFGWRIFQLPPELAYIALRVTDLVGLNLPDALVAGGRALQALQRPDDMQISTLSAVSPNYFTTPGLGLSVAGLAFYPLLLLGLLSFVLAALTSYRPGAPALQAARFAVWLIFGILALASYRLIPFFAVVAAPLTALNLSEFFRGRRYAEETAPPNWNSAAAARGVAVAFFLILFFLAWPGWLHGPADFRATHRVAWDVPEDPSLRSTAERLAELNAAGQCRGVFNFSTDLPSYCAWFAPGVKCFLDRRYSLFPVTAATHVQIQQALLDTRQAPETWAAVFRERSIDHVELQVPVSNMAAVYAVLWAQADRWAPVYNDGRTSLFAIALPGRHWPSDRLRQSWSAEAFGEVSAARRPPVEGAPPPPPAPPGFWPLYAEGVARSPLPASEARLKHLYFQWAGSAWKEPALRANQIVAHAPSAVMGLNAPPAPLNLICNLFPYVPLSQNSGKKSEFFVPFLNGHPRDAGPPAAPVLMVRLARQAVAENPRDVFSYRLLHESYRLLAQQEEHWTRLQRTGRENMRGMLREMQAAAALRNALQVKPDDPELHFELFQFYAQRNFLDLAAHHLERAALALQRASRPGDAQRLQTWENMRQGLDEGLSRRRSSYQLKAASAKGLDRYRWALLADYRITTPDNQVQIVPGGYGLTQTALGVLEEALQEPNRKNLNPRDYLEAATQLLRLLLRTGQVQEAANWLATLSKDLGPSLGEFNFFIAGVVGNYEAIDRILKDTAGALGEQTRGLAISEVSLALLKIGQSYQPAVDVFILQARLKAVPMHIQRIDFLTLAGITELEAGNTAQARQTLQEAMRLAGRYGYFSDRPLAERYLELLAQFGPGS